MASTAVALLLCQCGGDQTWQAYSVLERTMEVELVIKSLVERPALFSSLSMWRCWLALAMWSSHERFTMRWQSSNLGQVTRSISSPLMLMWGMSSSLSQSEWGVQIWVKVIAADKSKARSQQTTCMVLPMYPRVLHIGVRPIGGYYTLNAHLAQISCYRWFKTNHVWLDLWAKVKFDITIEFVK